MLAIVLVIGNFVGQAIAENDMANQFTANGFPVKPSVDIEGFPFLTQVVHKDFKKVVISASNIPAGPVTISTLNATITGMHLNSSWNGATIDHLTATAFVSLNSLTGGISSELGDAVSLTAVPDGPNKLKITGSVLGLSASGEVEIKQTGPQQITVELPTTGGLVGTLLGSSASFPINLPAGRPAEPADHRADAQRAGAHPLGRRDQCHLQQVGGARNRSNGRQNRATRETRGNAGYPARGCWV